MRLDFPRKYDPSPPLAQLPPPPSIIQYIRTLEVVNIADPASPLNPILETYFTTLHAFLTAPRLRDLSLELVPPSCFSSPFTDTLAPHYSSVTSLSLKNIRCGTAEELWTFLSNFQNLRSLIIHNVLWAKEGGHLEAQSAVQTQRALTVLRLRRLDLNFLYAPTQFVRDFTHFLSSITAETIVELCLCLHGDIGLEWIPDFLSRAIQLQHLTISLRHGKVLRQLGENWYLEHADFFL